ncbi:hypothetical protein N9D31_04145, partial [Oligoflexaceae bacterium]|nr:hypothetical protein [Oligoflexaceae bacterium]
LKAVVEKLKSGDILAIHNSVSISNKLGYGQSMMALTAKPKTEEEIALEKLERESAESFFGEINRYQPARVKGKKVPKTADDLFKMEP